MLVITGGEPMLQQPALLPLLQLARSEGWRVEVETAGTVKAIGRVNDLVTQFNISPKLSSSGNPVQERYRPETLDSFNATGRAVWKFVAVSLDDLTEIDQLVSRHSLHPVFVMPEGTEPEEISLRLELLAEQILARGWNLTTRLHIMLYGNRRGV
jgi:7-carboxy-7-deazaguanine synthase